MSELAPGTREVISFGPFVLDPYRRLLTRDGAPVDLGARTLDTLIVLVARPNQVVTKRELMAEVWPDVTVEENSLRFHVAALRKALGDGKDGARYIATLSGRGYCFVGSIARNRDAERAAVVASFSHANLPPQLSRMVGRDNDVVGLSDRLATARLVSIVGSGGVGKTTVAVAVGHHLMEAFSGAVVFVDLGMLSDPDLVATAAASMLGLTVRSDDATPSLLAWLRDKRILLILDTCEHLVEAVAALAGRIFAAAPQVHILATSREALQLEDEQVYRLEPLACPPQEAGLTAASVQDFPATQLFVERAVASGARLELSDAEAAIVGDICRKLDGVALAIELAARRVESYGLQQTADLLDKRLTLLWAGPRTATPRQKTLQATLDWSFGLLSDTERLVLRRLAVFVGHFTLDAALEVASSERLDQAVVLGAMDSLVAKSMVATRPVGAMMRYRLLDTTRAYAREIAIDSDELAALDGRHAAYYRRWFEHNGNDWPVLASGTERSAHFAALNNVRAALEWAFGDGGNARLGVSVAAAAAPAFLAMSLLPECHRWSERAMDALDEADRGGSEEMHLQKSLGISSMHMRGQSDAARAALDRSLEIAEARGDVLERVAVMGMITMFHSRDGDFKTALHYAKLSRADAGISEEAAPAALAHSILGRALHFLGDHVGARTELEAALLLWRGQQNSRYLGLDWRNLAGICLGWTLWLQGYPAQAVDRMRQAVNDAQRSNNPTSLAVTFSWAPEMFLWIGDLEGAGEHADLLIGHAQSHSLGPYLAVGRAYKGALAIRRGDAKAGVETLKAALAQLHAARFEVLSTEFKLALAQGLAAIGKVGEALALVDETMRLVEANGDLFYMPEALRVKAAFLTNDADAGRCLRQSLELSRQRGARSWELRAATDLATRLRNRGQSAEARLLLQPVFAQFTEGRDTADLQAAERLLQAIQS